MAPQRTETRNANTAPLRWLSALLATGMALTAPGANALNLSNNPLFVTESQPPAVMLTMGRDHKLYYEAYNDYSDLDGDGTLDIGYKPAKIDYYGYFDSYKCYTYDSGVFTPSEVTANKKCSGKWSGDFLNYVTTSRMDALRKVFYGGYRSTDTATKTILERAYIPQDAHAWGKEYKSIDRDGYDIREYTPLGLPSTGKYHLLANVTLTGPGSDPLMRVLADTPYRIWEWVSIERPVAGNRCMNQSTYCVSGTGGKYQSYPYTHDEFEALVTEFANAAHLQGTKDLTQINGSGNPFDAASNYYIDVIKGTFTANETGTWHFAVDGDDAVELLIDGSVVAHYYGDHGTCGGCTTNSGTANLTSGQSYTIEFRHQEREGGDSWKLLSKSPSGAWQITPADRFSSLKQSFYNVERPASTMTDYTVRVEVCNSAVGLESKCTGYGSSSTTYKPTGLLQKYGATNSMYFGLLTGSYAANTDGGILRKNIMPDSINSELNADGSFKSVDGIITTFNKLRIVGFDYSNQSYNGKEGSKTYYDCGWILNREMASGECQMWGNPLGEMVYEAVRYFSGKTTATGAFTTYPSGKSKIDTLLGLPVATWKDPFGTASADGGGLPHCAKPYIMAISDVYPSFDSDSVPGSPFGGIANDIDVVSGARADINVADLGKKMWDTEFGVSKSKSIFIGESGSDADKAPTPKTATTFSNLRGLAPGEPTRQGSYTSAEIAYWGHVNNLSGDDTKSRNLNFYSIALAPQLPTIAIPVTTVDGGESVTKTVTIMPFAKSVGGSVDSQTVSATKGKFQPTNQIVDFYVETIVNAPGAPTDSAVNGGRPKYVFRINYEDVEQGADHDMDAIVTYTIELTSDNKVKVSLSSDYAAGSIIHHMGFVISGTTEDGTYLMVRDKDTASGDDPVYFLDYDHTTGALPLQNSKLFAPGSTDNSAVLLKDPLWYAAKWGSFKLPVEKGLEVKPTGKLWIPSDYSSKEPESSWDANNDGVPDNYFLVINPLKLETQLTSALDKILGETGTAAALATNSSAWKQGAKLYQAKFSSDGWFGEVASKTVNSDGSTTTETGDWRAEEALASLGASNRNIVTYDSGKTVGARGIAFSTFGALPAAMQLSLNTNAAGTIDSEGSDRLAYLRGEVVSEMRKRPMIRDKNGNSTSQVNLLGDIVDSAIQFVGTPDFGYADPSYAAYRAANTSRTAMLYVGANDGFLHGFAASNGEEELAYIPSILFRNSKLNKLTRDDYGKTSNPHAYYVDGTPTVADVCTTCGTSGCSGNICPLPGTNWKTMLVGGLNGGGQSIYALDVSNPSTFSSPGAIPMWEFSDANDTETTDTAMQYGLGYTYSRPAVVKVCTARDSLSTSVPQACTASRWAAVFGNGYNNADTDGFASTSGHAILYILDALDGSKIKKISTVTGSAGAPNGLPNVAVADVDGDGVADYVYAGDLQGNMWKFDLTGNSSDTWSLAYSGSPLYIAKDSTGTKTQPITTAPELLTHPNGGLVVLFGTGLYLQEADKASKAAQTFYGIWDNGASLSTKTRADLQQQSIITDTSQKGFQTSTQNTVDWTKKNGWYMDLPNSGERVAFDPTLFRKVIYFTSLQPADDVCSYGGTSWDTFLDGLTGQALDFAVFTESTTRMTGTDSAGAAYSSYASRRASNVGITPQGTTIDFGQGTTQMYKGGSKKGEIENFGLKLGSGSARREAWREIIKD